MASPVELAVVEMQIVVREFNRRLAAIENRLGLTPDEFAPRSDRNKPFAPLAREKRIVTRTAQTTSDPYDIADRGTATAVAPEPRRAPAPPPSPSVPPTPPASVAPSHSDGPSAPIQVNLSAESASPSTPSTTTFTPAPLEPTPHTTPIAIPPNPTPTPIFIGTAAQPLASESTDPNPSIIENSNSKTTTPDTSIPILPPPLPPTPPPAFKKVADFMRGYNPQPKPQSTLERTLGMEVISWLASFAVMGSIIFFLKWGAEKDTTFSPNLRVSLALIAGAIMVATGLLFHVKKLGTISAALLGGGLAVMMSSLFAANVAFTPPVLDRNLALLSIGMVAVLGLALGMLTRSIALPILAVAGMYLSPIVLQGNDDQSLALLRYLLIVTACTLGLAQLKRAWDFLRLVAFVAAWLWLIYWTNSDLAKTNLLLGAVAVSSFFALFLAVICLNLKLALSKDPDQSQVQPQTELVPFWDGIGTIFSIVNSGLALLTLFVLNRQGDLHALWIPIALMGVAMGLMSLWLKTQYFSTSAAIQSVALFLVAIPLYLDHGTITLGYAFLALGFGIYASLTNSWFSRIFMFASLTLMAGHFFAFDSVSQPLQQSLFTIASTDISTWMLTGWGAGLLALALAWLARPTSRANADGTTELVGAPWATVACIALATLLVFVVNVRALEFGGPFTLAAVLWALALLAVRRSGALADVGHAVETLVGVLLMLLSVKWFLFEGVSLEATPSVLGQQSTLPFLNLFTVNGMLLAGSILFLNPMRESPAVGRRFVAWWITALAFFLLNIQTLRTVDYFMHGGPSLLGRPEFVKSVSLSALWALYASVMIALGFARKSPSIRYVALSLLAVAIAKVVFVDMATVETPLRVLAFLTLGILLFIVSYLYHRFVKQLPSSPTLGG